MVSKKISQYGRLKPRCDLNFVYLMFQNFYIKQDIVYDMDWTKCFDKCDHFSVVEFIEVGKPARALDTLQEVFRNKKWAYNWSESVLEPIMFKYLDLCVELKKSHIAKEGLFQYRNMFQSVCIIIFIFHFLPLNFNGF